MQRRLALVAGLAGLAGCSREPAPPQPEPRSEPQVELPLDAATTPAPSVDWQPGPHDPTQLGASTKPRVVRLTALWCQWCRVFEHEVLPDPAVRTALARSYESLEVDVDRSPQWMDLPGVEGLPALAFFDAQGRHVLTRSGHREADELVAILDAVARGLRTGEIAPIPVPARSRLGQASTPIDRARARAELTRLERAIHVLVNSNDGGFGTPSRFPHPNMLLALQRWSDRSERADEWIALTIEHALRGSSPRLQGTPLRGLELDDAELVLLSQRGPEHPEWRTWLDALPNLDAFRGLQDPIDHGVYRYCEGPGWYHPHFERRASDNLAWALLLRDRGQAEDAAAIADFVFATFSDHEPGLDAVQRSDPFYARLQAHERVGVTAPTVDPLHTLEVQALAARLDPARCALLLQLPTDTWPASRWPIAAGEPREEASVDAIGEALLGLTSCPGGRRGARELAELALVRWREEGFEPTPRLARLAAGVCEAAPERCAEVLGAIEGLPIDLDFPPPLAALARIARGRISR